jgi:putative membrane protein
VSAPPPSSFTFEPLFVIACAGACALYARHVKAPGTGRAVVFALGVVCIAIPLNSPLETIATHYLLLAHLAQNAITADIAPPLLILGLTPEARDAIVRRGGALLRAVTRPGIALPAWLACWYGIHLSGVYDLLLEHPLWLNAEHATLIAAGLLFWWPVLSGSPDGLSPPAGLLYLFAAFLTSVFLGLALTWLPSFYPYYQRAPRLWGISANEDQNVGGALMMAEQSVVFVTGMCWLFFHLLGGEDEQAIPLDQPAADSARMQTSP